MTALHRSRSPDVDPAGLLLAVPLGSTEQHGPHLPLGTDTAIARELCRRLCAADSGVVAAPALPFGSAGEHAGFAGTLSIGTAALDFVLVELVRSADDFAGVVLVNAHGGNHDAVGSAVSRLTAEGRRVLAWSPTGRADDSHAGHAETSVMLALDPSTVDLTAARPGNTEPLAAIIDALRAGGVRAVSANGVLGDPTHATAAEGERILRGWSADLVSAVDAWRAR